MEKKENRRDCRLRWQRQRGSHCIIGCWVCHSTDRGCRRVPMSAPPMPALSPEQQQLYRDLQDQMRADGTREQLKAFLKERLMEGQWKRDLTLHCQQLIYEKGLAGVTIEQLVESTHAKA